MRIRELFVGAVLGCVVLSGCAGSGQPSGTGGSQSGTSSSETTTQSVQREPVAAGAISSEWVDSKPSVNAKDGDPELAIKEIEKGKLFRVACTNAKKDSGASETLSVVLADGEGITFDCFPVDSRFMIEVSQSGDAVYSGPVEGYYGLNPGKGEFTVVVKPLCSNGGMMIEKASVDALCQENSDNSNFWMSNK